MLRGSRLYYCRAGVCTFCVRIMRADKQINEQGGTMKKNIKAYLALGLACASLFASCGTNGGTQTGNNGNTISAKPLSVQELGEGFNAAYLPDTSKITQFSGKIDVCLDFEGTQSGWRALAKEYKRLQGNAVEVNINTNYAGSSYGQKLNSELTNTNTDWDIVEGNLGYGSTYIYCIDMYSAIASYNPYCGKDVQWSSVLEKAAYTTKEADTSGKSIILNSEIMQTCWFVNDVALEAAGELGYQNASEEVGYPETWDDLIFLCQKMQEAGYSNPLGISLTSASVESLQFSWLLRVYGDYYYRQFYQYVMGGDKNTVWENYDETEEVVELNSGYGVRNAKLLNILFEEDCDFGPGYVGFTSEVYRDFVGQLAKMKGLLMTNVSSTEFGELRDKFEMQSEGKASPQIILDYQGFGINYEKAATDTFQAGYFDYPQMISGKYTRGDRIGESIVPETTLTRDIGGNGGFLSIINHMGDSAQNQLNKDFLKFVMSPYGQTIYYKGLAENGDVPKGLPSVKNDLVVIPNEWKSYFEESNAVIEFSGDVDANPFLGWGVRYVNGLEKTRACITELWQNLLMTGRSAEQTLIPATFAAKWSDAVDMDMLAQVAKNKWPENFWLDPNYNL